ncbi:hypothetical protein AVEN_182093-1 [Araneus ventricosus]|uniref:Uncharacterized protein n=1 Tax=Araneus ventricosus TaxID=182803 RepID=A0A4Y2L156_ARAVE|nr:hypothetical protein AVEN_182093-1 [Araneus ventricosus]
MKCSGGNDEVIMGKDCSDQREMIEVERAMMKCLAGTGGSDHGQWFSPQRSADTTQQEGADTTPPEGDDTTQRWPLMRLHRKR